MENKQYEQWMAVMNAFGDMQTAFEELEETTANYGKRLKPKDEAALDAELEAFRLLICEAFQKSGPKLYSLLSEMRPTKARQPWKVDESSWEVVSRKNSLRP